MAPPRGGIALRRDQVEVGSHGKPRLMGSKCPECGIGAFPAERACSRCLHEPLDAVALSAEGTLYSFSRVHVPPGPGPYVLGYVDLPEGVRVFAQISESAGVPLAIDMTVHLTADIETRNGEGEVLVAWTPAGDP